jgi:hypothetical protein
MDSQQQRASARLGKQRQVFPLDPIPFYCTSTKTSMKTSTVIVVLGALASAVDAKHQLDAWFYTSKLSDPPREIAC